MALKDNGITLAPVGSTGNGDFAANGLSDYGKIAVEFQVEAAGTTVSYTIQGSVDGVNFVDLMYLDSDSSVAASKAAIVVTTVSKTFKFLDGLNYRFFESIRVHVTANTGMTYSARLYGYSGAQ